MTDLRTLLKTQVDKTKKVVKDKVINESTEKRKQSQDLPGNKALQNRPGERPLLNNVP